MMGREKMKSLVALVEKRITLNSTLCLCGGVAGLLFTYALADLARLSEYGAYSLLQERIVAIAEHGVMIGLIGLCGGLLFDLLKKEGEKE